MYKNFLFSAGLICVIQSVLLSLGLCAPQTVVVNGSAPVISGDRIQARDEALADARLRAIEQVSGIKINAKSVFSHELMVSSSMNTSSAGVIENEKVLSESVDSGGTYHLKLKATVSPEESRKGLKKLLREDRIVLQICEEQHKNPSQMSILLNHLTQKLSQNGYQQIIHVKPPYTENRSASPDHYSIADAEDLAIKHLADIVIAGTISSAPSSKLSDVLYSAHAEGWIRVFAVKKQRLLSSVSLSGIRGFGPNTEQAAKDAIKKISDQLTQKALEQIADRSFREISVVFYDIADFDAFKKYKNLLSLMRWVQDVKSTGFSSAKTVFKIQYAEDPEILASRLDLRPNLSITGFDQQQIKIRVGNH